MLTNKELLSNNLKITTHAIVKRAIERGFEVTGFETSKAVLRLKDKRENTYYLFSAAPPQTSYAVSKILKDKRVTAQILKSEGFPVPEELLLRTREYEKDSRIVDDFLKRHKKVVMKPLDGAHGNGINADISSAHDVEQYIVGKDKDVKRILLQEFVEGDDLRIVIVGYEYANAIVRVPATVVGDGKHTISELIEIENSREVRSKGYRTNLTNISTTRAEGFLKHKINNIPIPGEAVRVVDISNVGVGGTRVNVTDKVPLWLRDEAERISRTLQAPVCGIDFIFHGVLEHATKQEDLSVKVIEVNSCPGLVQYEDDSSAEQIGLIDRYIDFATDGAHLLR